MDRPQSLEFTESEEANELLARNDLALLLGMLLDQQFPMERAFYGPYLLQERMGSELTAESVASTDLDDLESHFRGPPAIHRYHSSMAGRARDLCSVIVDEYGGEAGRLWEEAADGRDLLKRLEALPGFGKRKSRIFIGLLGKRLGCRPDGWQDVAADWPSIADVERFSDVADLREKKKAMRKQGG